MNLVMAEMVNITAKEKVLLGQCQGLLSRVASMQVKECSLSLSSLLRYLPAQLFINKSKPPLIRLRTVA